MKVFRIACAMCKKAGLLSIIFFQTWPFHLHYPKYIPETSKNYWTLVAIPVNGPLPVPSFNQDMQITIMDLPGQLNVAESKSERAWLSDRIHFYPVNIWMKQQLFQKVLMPSG